MDFLSNAGEKPLEEMVRLLLPTQINMDFHIECLKAQAIIIRNNLIRSSLKPGGKSCTDLWENSRGKGPLDLKYLKDCWKDNYNIKKIDKAVLETLGLIITFKGKPIMAYYHNCCGGSTENSEDVLDHSITYLRKVLCSYCKDTPSFKNISNINIDQLGLLTGSIRNKNICNKTELNGYIDNIVRDESGRVKSININGKEFTGKELMNKLSLNSNRYYISPLSIEITTIGNGHGLGFCQSGGNEMAKEGYNFEEILKYYYTGIEIEKYALPSINKPLFGKIIVLDPGHGGMDFGHTGKYGLTESDISLKFSKILKSKLEKYGAVVYLTRKEDIDVLLRERGDLAAKYNPDFMLSIHMNYFPNSTMEGCEIYHFIGDTESKRLGEIMLKRLEGDIEIVNRGVKEGKYSLFKNVGNNLLIVELGFLSNINDEMKFLDSTYLNKMAGSMTKGIIEYYEN